MKSEKIPLCCIKSFKSQAWRANLRTHCAKTSWADFGSRQEQSLAEDRFRIAIRGPVARFFFYPEGICSFSVPRFRTRKDKSCVSSSGKKTCVFVCQVWIKGRFQPKFHLALVVSSKKKCRDANEDAFRLSFLGFISNEFFRCSFKDEWVWLEKSLLESSSCEIFRSIFLPRPPSSYWKRSWRHGFNSSTSGFHPLMNIWLDFFFILDVRRAMDSIQISRLIQIFNVSPNILDLPNTMS